MSRLAKKPVIVPQGVAVEFKNGVISARGPKGELSRNVPAGITFEISAGEVFVRPTAGEKEVSAFLGTFFRHLKNMVEGVSQGFENKLEITATTRNWNTTNELLKILKSYSLD